MKLSISDPKTRKAYPITTEKPLFLNKKVNDKVDLEEIGLKGYKAIITGGSDKQGFPMKPTLSGTIRKKLLMKKGVGYNAKRKGIKKRKSVRGNTISEEIEQVNLKIVEYGKTPLNELIKKEEKTDKKSD